MPETEPPSPDDRLIDLDEAARLLTIPLPTIKKMYKDGRLPVVRIGRSIRFLRRDLTDYIAEHRTPATAA